MGKKKNSPPEEMTASAMEAPEQRDGAPNETPSGDPESTGAPQGDGASTEAFEAEGGDGKPSADAEEMQAELTAIKDRHLRLVAEFTNYRRRAEGELSEAWGRGQADMLRSFVDGLDDLQRVGAWQAESTTVEALVEGVDLVERKFRQALEASGVELIDPVGQAFDPNLMEAMLGVPTENPEDDQKVQEVFQKGYLFKGNLVRPARVVVFKHG